MEPIAYHLDRGWDLAQKGDGEGARACAERALKIEPSSAEGHNLLGFAATLEGDPDVALKHYRRAIELDDSYLDAMLNVAELLIHVREEWDEAIAVCDQALGYAKTDEETTDCILLKVEALMAKSELEEAKKRMTMIPGSSFGNPSYIFLIGRAYYELGELEKATPLIEEAAQKDPTHSDAQYYLGLVRDEGGDSQGATEAFLRARTLDLDREAPSWAPPADAFAKLVRDAINGLDVILARYIQEAEVYVVDVPGAELVVDGVDPRALMIVDAPSPAEDGTTRGRIFVYQRNVERAAGSFDAIHNELGDAFEREITAVFLEKEPGMSPPGNHHLN